MVPTRGYRFGVKPLVISDRMKSAVRRNRVTATGCMAFYRWPRGWAAARPRVTSGSRRKVSPASPRGGPSRPSEPFGKQASGADRLGTAVFSLGLRPRHRSLGRQNAVGLYRTEVGDHAGGSVNARGCSVDLYQLAFYEAVPLRWTVWQRS